ncbi:MAG TPA: glycine cleavage system protein GcvH [Parafilimonas sp.]|nr:glycine cleavage system protein GcvH [Parafilimonas sp.]
MQFPSDYKYSKEHTWIKIEGQTGTIGITEFAQSELGEIVYVDLPSVGKQFKKDEIFGSVEAIKTTSDLFMPVSGEVIETNAALKDDATLVNSASFTDGWMIKIILSDSKEIDTLLNAGSYEKIVS